VPELQALTLADLARDHKESFLDAGIISISMISQQLRLPRKNLEPKIIPSLKVRAKQKKIHLRKHTAMKR